MNMKITFISNLEDQSYEHYLQQPKQMIERSVARLIQENPNLIKKISKDASTFYQRDYNE